MAKYKTITAKHNTWLKQLNCKVDGQILASNDADFKGEYQELGKIWAIESIGERIAGHTLVVLAYGAGSRYVFDDHWSMDSEEKEIALPLIDNEVPVQSINIIKEFEGCKLHAYADPIHGWSVPTIGIGTTVYPDGSKVNSGDVITEQQAVDYLLHWIRERILPNMENIPTWTRMNDNQRSAIISFAYNLGAGFYNGANFNSITKLCDSPSKWSDQGYVTQQFIKYRNPGTSAEKGLLRRRKAEAALFCKGVSVNDFNQPANVKPVKNNASNEIDYTTLNNPEAVKRQADRLKKYVPVGTPIDLSTSVIYAPQRDNPSQQHRTCNTSSNAMYTDWLLRATNKAGLGVQTDGDLNDNNYFNRMLTVGDTTYHSVQTNVIKQYGFNTKWMGDKDLPFVLDLLKVGFPVVCNILHRGSLSSPRGGHVIVLVGINPSYSSNVNNVKELITHDPYGTLVSNYRNTNGKYSRIKLNEFKIRWQGGYRILS